MVSSPIDTSKRVAVITGCSEITSLGANFALELLSRNWTVFATARNESTLTKLADAGCQTLRLDVTSDESVADAAQKVSALTGGRVDLLIKQCAAAFLNTDPKKLAAMHDLHVLGPLRLVQAFFPYLRQTAQSSSKRAKIVNIGSVLSHGLPWHAAYATTKAGTEILSDGMRREFAPFNIDVITVELGLVTTAMSTGAKEFDLELKDTNGAFDARKAIDAALEGLKKDGESAPTASQVAKDIINAVEKSKSPGKMWLGKNGGVFRWLVPYLPTFAADMMFSKLMRVDLIKA